MLGTYVEVSISGDVDNKELLDISEQAYVSILNIQTSMSFHDPLSELSRLNLSPCGSIQKISGEMSEILGLINVLNTESKGYFDPCIAPYLIKSNNLPTPRSMHLEHYQGRWSDIEFDANTIRFKKPLMIDLGGIAKGYAIDKAIDAIPNHVQACVNAGGDMRMNHWIDEPVVINHGTSNLVKSRTETMRNASVASSAAYYNNGVSVIVDPTTMESIHTGKTYSVFAERCVEADGLTKLAWLLNDSKPALLDSILERYQAELIVTE